MYNLCSRRYTDAVIQPGRRKNESQAMVRFKLADCIYECVITNLPQDKYPPYVLKELYGKR